MVGQPVDQRVPVVEVVVHRLALRGERPGEPSDAGKPGRDRGLDVVDQLRQPAVVRSELGQVGVDVGSQPGEFPAGLADPHVARVDAQPDLVELPQPVPQFDETLEP